MFLQIKNTGKNHWWRWLLTFLFTVLGLVIGQIPFTVAAFSVGMGNGLTWNEVGDLAANNDLAALGLSNNLSLFLLILSFGGGLLGLWFGLRFLHERPFRSLITPGKNIDRGKIFYGFWMWMALTAALEFVFFLMYPENYSFQFRPLEFLVLLVIALLFLPIQTSFEEIFFRGYLMQGIGLLAKYRWVPLVITALLFGALHFSNPEVKAYGLALTMPYYIGVGLFLGVVTLMDDGLELALGVHAATNIYGALFVTFPDTVLPTAAIFKMAEVNMLLMLIGFVVVAVVFVFLAAKKYGWQDWAKCYGETSRPHLGQP